MRILAWWLASPALSPQIGLSRRASCRLRSPSGLHKKACPSRQPWLQTTCCRLFPHSGVIWRQIHIQSAADGKNHYGATRSTLPRKTMLPLTEQECQLMLSEQLNSVGVRLFSPSKVPRGGVHAACQPQNILL